MKLAAIIRADTGVSGNSAERKVQECLLDELGASLHSVRMAEPRLFGVACLKALDEHPDALVVVGGNTTARHAGEIAYQHKIPVAFLPGTRPNIVARRLWGARSAETIIGLVARGEFMFARIDAGCVCGRVFLSSASCGAVAHMTHVAPAQFGAVLRQPRVTLRRRGAKPVITAGFLAGVAASDRASSRPSRQFPKLQCWSLPRQNLPAMVKSMIKATRGADWLAEPADYFEAGEITLEANSPILMALDGELMPMASLLRLQLLPGAIQTMIPRVEVAHSAFEDTARPRQRTVR